MRILIVLAEPYPPQQTGGSQLSAHELALLLEEKGIETRIAAGLKRKSAFGAVTLAAMSLKRATFVKGRTAGVVVYRAVPLERHIGDILDDFVPDAVILHAMSAMSVAHAISDKGVPLVVYWHDVEFKKLMGTPQGLVARYAANSNFTAATYEAQFGVRSVVVPPLIHPTRYVAEHHTRDRVTFIGLVPDKGGDIAFAVAERCPEIPFEFVESWLLPRPLLRILERRIARLPNVTFTRHLSSMVPLYGRTKILLAPSQWQEAWGRVASEAHLNGIPVIGSRIGGLQEAIGPGGIQIEPKAPPQVWAEALKSVWHDEAKWRELSAAALAYSQRAELQPATIQRKILDVVAAAIKARQEAA